MTAANRANGVTVVDHRDPAPTDHSRVAPARPLLLLVTMASDPAATRTRLTSTNVPVYVPVAGSSPDGGVVAGGVVGGVAGGAVVGGTVGPDVVASLVPRGLTEPSGHIAVTPIS